MRKKEKDIPKDCKGKNIGNDKKNKSSSRSRNKINL